jgi:hypothetical protein
MAANTAGISVNFKSQILSGIHALGTTVVRGSTAADTVKGALMLANSSLSNLTATYTTTNEVSGTGYTAGGNTVANSTAPAVSGTSAIWTPSANLVWTGLTLATAFDTLQLYNSTQSNASIAMYNFGSQTISAGTLTLTMPTNAVGTALIGLS